MDKRRRRLKNEKAFTNHEEHDTGRRYWFDVRGRGGGFARYVKEVDSEEQTISFRQEIYNAAGILIEIHEKYPIDKGHQKL